MMLSCKSTPNPVGWAELLDRPRYSLFCDPTCAALARQTLLSESKLANWLKAPGVYGVRLPGSVPWLKKP